MNVWTLGMTMFAGILIVFGIWGRLEERRWRRNRKVPFIHGTWYVEPRDTRLASPPHVSWPDESDGVDLTDRDWDLAAKLEVYEKDQDA